MVKRTAGMVARVVRPVGVLAVLTLVACSGGRDAPPPDDLSSPPTVEATPAPTAMPRLQVPGPLEVYLGFADTADSPGAIVARFT